jgi:beta-1,4-mannosyltransferase
MIVKTMKMNVVHVTFLPQVKVYSDGGNPYWERLQASLEQGGIEFVSTDDPLYLQWRWLVRHRDQVDVLHLHHVQHHYACNEEEASGQMLLKFVGKLLLARLLGYRIVWTMHNLYPHKPLQPARVGRLARLALAQLSHAVIVHCERARESLAREFYRRRKVFVTPHPSYVDVYPDEMDREQARRALGLCPEQQVFLFLGAIRPYKGINSLIHTFRQFPDGNWALLIVGKPWDEAYLIELRQAIDNDRRITLRPQFVPNEELQIYFKAADVTVLPFTQVLSSGSALLALSFGCPVVAPDVGCMSDTVTPDVGILYDPAAPDGLYRALEKCQSLDLPAMRQNAWQRASQLTWEAMAQQTLPAYGQE